MTGIFVVTAVFCSANRQPIKRIGEVDYFVREVEQEGGLTFSMVRQVVPFMIS